ncbi:fungal-specific transcription factor domain-containing protein [Xylaria scruposa]|nr:fungal-specific transcription factor domain-containing protein [Xylaria scruposa]
MSFTHESPYTASQATTQVSHDVVKSGQRPRQQPGSANVVAENYVATKVQDSVWLASTQESNVSEEQLQSRLNEQQQDQPGDEENNTHLVSTPINEEPSSKGDNDASCLPLTISTDLEPVLGDLQSWTASLSSLESIDQLGQNITIPAFEYQQGHIQAPISLEQHLTPIICNDLWVVTTFYPRITPELTVNNRDQLYFDRVHVFTPMVQISRYLSWTRQLNKTKPKKCLQYAMWTLATSLSSQFQMIRQDLYAETRQLLYTLDADEQEHQCLEQAQAWILLSFYELTSTAYNYHRGFVSAGRAFRLIQIMKLDRMDGPCGTPTSPGPLVGDLGRNDWVDLESRRRTFWVAYTLDRLTSAMDGLSLTFDDRQITTRLPLLDSDLTSMRPTVTRFLHEAMDGLGNRNNSSSSSSSNEMPFTQPIIVAAILGRALEHDRHNHAVPRLLASDQSNPMTEFSFQHQSLDLLSARLVANLSASLSFMPENPDPTLIFVALAAYTTEIVICETLESRLSSTDTPGVHTIDPVFNEIQQRSLEAVRKLRMLITTLGRLNQFQMNPFTPVPLILSARSCLKHVGLSDAYSDVIPDIAKALEALSKVNGLSQRCLALLNLEYSEAYKG